MKSRWFFLLLGIGCIAWQIAGPTPCATPRIPLHAPVVVLLEGHPDDPRMTDVVLRATGSSVSHPVLLGTVHHAARSARRGVVLPGPRPVVLVVAAEQEPHAGGGYDSALFRVQGGSVVRLAGGIADASRPLVTSRGTVLVQRGTGGTGDLTIDAVDPITGTTSVVWHGAGQTALLATALAGDEVLVDHVTPSGAFLFALDAGNGHVRAIAGPVPSLARDFSYDARRDEVVFTRPARVRGMEYDVVAVPAHPAAGAGGERVLFRAWNDRLTPKALADGTVALSLPGDHGLAVLRDGAVERIAPLGDGTDAVLDEAPGWLAVRHRTRERELFVLAEHPGVRTLTIDRPDRYVEMAGFVRTPARPAR